MNSNIFRNFVKLNLWILITVVSLFICLWAILEHYLSAKSALEIAGAEQQEVWRDPLIGQFLGAFVPDATLPQALALTISLVLALSFFMVFKELFTLIELINFKRARTSAIKQIQSETEEHLAQLNKLEGTSSNEESEISEVRYEVLAESRDLISSEQQQSRLATDKIIIASFIVGFFIILLIWAIYYEIELFTFRALAGSLGIDSPDKALSIPTFENAISTNSNSLAIHLADIGAKGYLALTALGSLALERCLNKVDEQFHLLFPPADNNQFDASDEACELSYNDQQELPDSHISTNTEAFNSNEEEGVSNSHVSSYHETPGFSEEDDEATVVNARVRFDNTNQSEATQPVNNSQLFDPSLVLTQQNNSSFASQLNIADSNKHELQEVIGNHDRLQISFATALAQPQRFYVHPSTGKIWDRSYWETLHSISLDEDQSKAA